MRIVFFGTPDFAVPSLRALLGEGFNIVAVVTQPDRARGRSRSVKIPSAVKTVALEEEVPILQPVRPNTAEFIAELKTHQPEMGVVVAYGHILRRDLLYAPTRGMINVHASLLPMLRGAAPIQHALLQGMDETGVSIMQMDEGMDTGPVLHQVTTPIAPDETYGELQTRLAEIGALALIEALTIIELDQADPKPQNDADATLAPKITRETARIDWDRSAIQVARLVRAMDPTPGAWSILGDHEVKLFGPRQTDWPPATARPGEILATDPALVIATGEGALSFDDVQPAGRQRMPASDWIRGRGAAIAQQFV